MVQLAPVCYFPRMRKLLCILALSMVAVGCVRKEPEGPAEQIGKGIDQMTKGIKQLDSEQDDAYRARQREEAIRDSRKTGVDGDATPGEWESYEEWQKRKGYR